MRDYTRVRYRSKRSAHRIAWPKFLPWSESVLLDASLFKNFLIKEGINAQFRFSAYNVLNRVNRSTPNGDINNQNDFGGHSEQRRRQMEFSFKLIF